MSNFRRRLMKSLKNKEYTELEYIESTGTQYIDTGYCPNPSTTKVETTFILTNNTVTTQGLLGSRNQNILGNGSCNIFFNVNKDNLRLDWVAKQIHVKININEEITLICINNEVTVIQNDISTTYTGAAKKLNVEIPYSIYIGNFNNVGNAYKTAGYAKWKTFKIYDENDNLIRDMIPVLDKNNIACMYDKVNKEFYYNQGTGEFIAGPIALENYFNYEDFYNNYVTLPQSNVGKYAIKLEPNISYKVSTNLKYGNSAKVFAVSGSNTNWTPSTSINGVLPDNPRTITTNSQGYMCIGIYVTGANIVNKSEFENGTAWIKIEKVKN